MTFHRLQVHPQQIIVYWGIEGVDHAGVDPWDENDLGCASPNTTTSAARAP